VGRGEGGRNSFPEGGILKKKKQKKERGAVGSGQHKSAPIFPSPLATKQISTAQAEKKTTRIMSECCNNLSHQRAERALDNIFGSLPDLLDMPLIEQARYADHICVEGVDQGSDWIKEQICDDEFAPEGWNSTSVGNIAYVALHYRDAECRAVALDQLNRYVAWYKAQKSHRDTLRERERETEL
jgi:hypothetical protein